MTIYDENFKFYRPDPWDGLENINALAADGSQDQVIQPDWVLLTREEVEAYYERKFAPDPVDVEEKWRDAEIAAIPEQLMMIEDGDPTALPGTERQWRDYRIALRAWKEGADGWPDSAHRPARPA